METSRLFMSLLMELGGPGDGFFYKHVASNGARRPERLSFSTEPRAVCAARGVALNKKQPRMLSGLVAQAESLCSVQPLSIGRFSAYFHTG